MQGLPGIAYASTVHKGPYTSSSHFRGIPVIIYLDYLLLLQKHTSFALYFSVYVMLWILQDFWWVFNIAN